MKRGTTGHNFILDLVKNFSKHDDFQIISIKGEASRKISRNISVYGARKSFAYALSLYSKITFSKDIDIIQWFGMLNPSATLLRFLLRTKPNIVSVLSLIHPDLFLTRFLLKAAFVTSDTVIASTNEGKKRITSLGISSNKIKKIPLGVDVKKFFPPRSKEEAKMRCNIAPNRVTITFISQDWTARSKGINEVLRSIPDVVNDIDNVLYIFAIKTGGQRKDTLRQMGLTESLLQQYRRFIKILGPVRDVPALLQATDILALPVLSTAGIYIPPLIALEAQACGVPVVSYDLKGIDELIEDGYNGLLLPKGTPISDALHSLISNEEQREELEKNARRIVTKEFNICRISKEYREIYQSFGV